MTHVIHNFTIFIMPMNTRSGRILGISEMTTFSSFQLFIEQITPWVQDVDTQNLFRPIAHLSISEHI